MKPPKLTAMTATVEKIQGAAQWEVALLLVAQMLGAVFLLLRAFRSDRPVFWALASVSVLLIVATLVIRAHRPFD